MLKAPPKRRYSCRDCNHEFFQPTFREVPEPWPAGKPRHIGTPVVYTCPKCESANIRGLANPDPFTPVETRFD